jgi:cytochrome c peroxidase
MVKIGGCGEFWRCLRLAAIALLIASCAPSFPPATKPRLNPDLVQRGALLFRDARISADGSRSCNDCHRNGGSTNKVYAEGDEVAPGTPEGRKVPPLRGVWQSAPYLWDGSAATVRAALERMLRVQMRAAQLPILDVAALEAYVLSIPPYDSGRIEADGTPVEPATLSARRGFAVFKRLECTSCHRLPSFTHPSLRQIGSDGKWSVPSLRGVTKHAPYGHDGRWKDLETAVNEILRHREAELTNAEFRQLLAYLELL